MVSWVWRQKYGGHHAFPAFFRCLQYINTWPLRSDSESCCRGSTSDTTNWASNMFRGTGLQSCTPFCPICLRLSAKTISQIITNSPKSRFWLVLSVAIWVIVNIYQKAVHKWNWGRKVTCTQSSLVLLVGLPKARKLGNPSATLLCCFFFWALSDSGYNAKSTCHFHAHHISVSWHMSLSSMRVSLQRNWMRVTVCGKWPFQWSFWLSLSAAFLLLLHEN